MMCGVCCVVRVVQCMLCVLCEVCVMWFMLGFVCVCVASVVSGFWCV